MSDKGCSFDGCERNHWAKGLCSAHYQQYNKGKMLRPLRRPKGAANGPCAFDGCNRPDKSFGLCAGHYSQRRRGEELAPLKRTAAEIDAETKAGIRTCSPKSGCGRTLPLDQFQSHADNRSGRHLWCKECCRNKGLQKRYRLTSADWDKMFEKQGRQCAICKADEPGGGRGWVVDHDHACCPSGARQTCGLCVRAILCHQCNITVGYLELHPDIGAALAYVNS